MVMVMAGIQMRGNHYLIFPFQQLLCQFQTDQMRKFRRYLSGRKALDQVIPLYAIHFMEPALSCKHIRKRILTGTADGIFKYHGFCFIPVQGIIDGFLQRSSRCRRLCGLFLIFDIVNGIIQTVDRYDAGICHKALPFLFHDLPYFF